MQMTSDIDKTLAVLLVLIAAALAANHPGTLLALHLQAAVRIPAGSWPDC